MPVEFKYFAVYSLLIQNNGSLVKFNMVAIKIPMLIGFLKEHFNIIHFVSDTQVNNSLCVEIALQKLSVVIVFAAVVGV